MQLAHRGDPILTCGHGEQSKYSAQFECFSLVEYIFHIRIRQANKYRVAGFAAVHTRHRCSHCLPSVGCCREVASIERAIGSALKCVDAAQARREIFCTPSILKDIPRSASACSMPKLSSTIRFCHSNVRHDKSHADHVGHIGLDARPFVRVQTAVIPRCQSKLSHRP